MEKEENKAKQHELHIVCRSKGTLTGIEKVISSNAETLNLVSSCGPLVVSGEKLKILRFNASDGTLEFEGEVNAIKYAAKKQPLLKRLFK
ncbi:MAG: hypothetical protein K2M95_03070 [Clostridiales bacterium]|nr:hypothetical protein [Clostridiales bacterium]